MFQMQRRKNWSRVHRGAMESNRTARKQAEMLQMLEKEVKVHICGSIIWSSVKVVTFPFTLPNTFCIFSFVLDGQVHEFCKIFRIIFNTFCFLRLFLKCKMDPKIDAKSYPGGACRHLRSLPEASRRPSTLVFKCNRPWMREINDFGNFPARPGGPWGSWRVPKIHSKSCFC